jgi:23S rRNA (pseudouridine1915-N3)-methyltransferase
VKLVIVAVGKIREAGLRSAMDEYLARIRHYATCDEIELRDESGFGRGIPRDSWVVACEVNGSALSSEQFARRLETWFRKDKGIVTFLIGGAAGIPAPASSGASARLSLSSMTFPHRLARVMLAEQLYRAFTILRGEPYAQK